MAFCVVNYPTLRSTDFDWIQSIRQQYDHLFLDVVAPHFTLVFPTDEVDKSDLIEHVTQKAAEFQAFDFVCRCAILGDPGFMDHAHGFLIPDEGFSDFVHLHDQLYTGILKTSLRLDLPYIPHIGIASTPSLEAGKAIVDQLNQEKFEIRGRVDRLDVIGYDGQKTWDIETCSLAPREPSSQLFIV